MNKWASKQKGFTIVELLIVIVVIAILAAITIVAYNGIQSRARVSAAQAAATQAQQKVQIYKVDHSDQLPATLADAGVSDTGSAQYQYTVINQGYCLTATQSNQSAYTGFNYVYNDGTTVNQSSPIAGACPGHSSSGGTVIRNLATNPSFESGTTGWTGVYANIAVSPTWVGSGAQSLRAVNTGTTNLGDVRITSSASTMPFGMEPGKTYTISARLYFTAAPTGGFGRAPGILAWYSTDGSSWTESFGSKPSTTPGTYTVSHTLTLPANTTGVLIAFGVASSTANQNFFYDSFMVTEGSTVYNFADGNSTNWIWLGTPNASASTGPAL